MSDENGNERRTYTTEETARIFGISPWSYRRLCRQGSAPVLPIKGIGNYRFSRALVDYVVDGQEQAKAVAAEVR